MTKPLGACFLVLLGACAGERSAPRASAPAVFVAERPAPAEPADSDAPQLESEPEPSALPAASGAVTYVIEGEEVDRARFLALYSRLVVDERATYGDRVENADGSYGGASEMFGAIERGTDAGYIFTNSVVAPIDGPVTTTFSITRAE